MSGELIVLLELESASGLTRAEIVELVEYGVFAPQGERPEDWRFPEDALALARDAARLRAGLNAIAGIGAVARDPRLTREVIYAFVFRVDDAALSVSRNRFVRSLDAEDIPAGD